MHRSGRRADYPLRGVSYAEAPSAIGEEAAWIFLFSSSSRRLPRQRVFHPSANLLRHWSFDELRMEEILTAHELRIPSLAGRFLDSLNSDMCRRLSALSRGPVEL